MTYPLPSSTPAQLGLDPAALERLMQLVTRHVAERRYPGAQLAIARHGKLALARTLGAARLDPGRVAATDDTLWLLYSNTKVLTACAVWLLADRGALSFTDTVAAHVPGFEATARARSRSSSCSPTRRAFRRPRCPRRCGTITSCFAGPSASSRSSGRPAARCTTTGWPPTGRRRC